MKNKKLFFLLFISIRLYCSEKPIGWNDPLRYSQLNQALLGGSSELVYDREQSGGSFFLEQSSRPKKTRGDRLLHELKKIFCPCLLPQKEKVSVYYANSSDGTDFVDWDGY